jgi:23S rRNA pseudouridine2605 synthase
MPKRNPSGPTKGRRASSPRSNSAGKPFPKKSEHKSYKKSVRGPEKPFRKSSSPEDSFHRADTFSGTSRPSGNSFDKSERKNISGKPSFGKNTEYGKNFSGDSIGKRPYKKFDKRVPGSKPFFNKEEKLPYGEERRSFSADSKRDKPYKKFNKEDKPRQNERRSSFPGGSKEERPYKKFDKANPGNRTSFNKNDKPPYKKKDSFSPRTDRPYKKFDKGGSPDKPAFNRGGKPFPQKGGESRDERTYKKFDKAETKKLRSSDSQETTGPFRAGENRSKSDTRSSQSFREESKKNEDGKIRLNKFIANSGVCSRREADELITMGLISVNGKTVTELGYKVNPGDEVRHESKVLRAEKPVYILLNKPKGFLTTTVDPQERNTVMHLIANFVKERVYPVGRLDRNTTGLLLLTNDGDLAEKLMHPSYNVKKIYKVELDRPLTKADAQRILEGVKLEEGRATVDDLAIISDDRKTVGIEIHIGWNRVVRRIFEALEYNVTKLDRSVYAGLNKKDLGRGEWRFLKKEELVLLKHFQ